MRRLGLLTVPVGGIVASVTWIALVARSDEVAAARVGMALAGVMALLSGGTVIGWSWRRHHRGTHRERPRVLLGLAVLVWGAGQVLLSLQVTATGQRTFGAGDLVSSFAVPVVVLASLTMPRRSRVSRPALRLGMDALVVTTTGTLAVWWLLLQPGLRDPAHPGGSSASGVLMASFDLGTVAITALLWARDRRRGAAAVTLGLALQALADIASLPAVVSDRALPWVSGPIWCVALPLLALGVISYATDRPASPDATLLEDLGESRVTMISTVSSLLVLAVLLGVPTTHRWTAIGVTLGAVTLVLLVGRELMNGLVRNRMVRWLNTEALRDVLTGLPNRSAMTTRIRGLDLSRPWVLLTVDLDGFKEVNDLLGTEAGDELIMLVGVTLQRNSPPQCLVARMGGDEFGILAPGTIEDGERLAGTLHEAVRRSVHDRGAGVALTASIGVGRVQPDDDEPAGSGTTTGTTAGVELHEVGEHHDRLSAVVESEAALRAAKAAGRNQIALYPGVVEQARRRRMILERRLRAAICAGSLEMHAQPLVDLRTGRVAAFESLARWTDEILGPVSPAEFVPVAEQSGLVAALGEFALRNTLLQAGTGDIIGRDIELGVNVSPIQLRNPAFAPMVVDLVAQLGMEPRQLLLEVTEAILIDEDDPASGALAQLHEAGIQLAIDDFGTGDSALGYLRRLPVDELKIDRSWVVAAVTDERTRDIVGGVVALAHTLGASVVMEGIEDEETAQLCRDLDADLGQGWHFGRPKPWPVAAEELELAPVRRPAVPQPATAESATERAVSLQG